MNATATPSLREAFANGSPTFSARSGDRAIDASIEPLFDKLTELCTLPAVAQQVIQVAENEGSDATDLLHVVEQDAAVAARLMQVVNSAYCGLRDSVGDLRTAITLLGVDRVKNLALTVSVGDVYRRDTPVGRLDPERLWDHSVCVATVSRLVAERSKVGNPEEAYLAGLLHDIGLLFINQHLPALVPKVLAHCATGCSLSNSERKVLAFDHCQLAAYVAWRANFPVRLVEAIDYHHSPHECPEEGRELARVIAVGNYLATRFGRGSIAGRRLPAPAEGLLSPLGLDLRTLSSLWSEMPDMVENAKTLVSA